MSCNLCASHRQAIKNAVKTGSITKVSIETSAALRTFGNQMVKAFGQATIKKPKDQ